MNETVREFQLTREGDAVHLRFADGAEAVPVKLVWARPLTARGSDVSFVGADKQEVLMVRSLDALDADSRKVAEEELARRYVFPKITRVLSAVALFGVRYWEVETDIGARRFALKNAAKNAVWLSDEHLVLNDTLGCRYEINPLSALDPRSRLLVEKVI